MTFCDDRPRPPAPCLGCGYDLRGALATIGRCPECGGEYDRASRPAPLSRPGRWRLVLPAVIGPLLIVICGVEAVREDDPFSWLAFLVVQFTIGAVVLGNSLSLTPTSILDMLLRRVAVLIGFVCMACSVLVTLSVMAG